MKIEGTLTHFNHSPKGSFESLILSTRKGAVQVNFQSYQASALVTALKEGEKVSLDADRLEDGHHSPHPVYQLVGLKQKGAALDLAATVRVKGVVTRLNHALHGEVNGAVLDSGDFVHLKAGGAKAIGLVIGQTLRASGSACPMLFGGHRAIEAQNVNGLDLVKHEHAKKAAKKAAKKTAKKAAKKTVKKAAK